MSAILFKVIDFETTDGFEVKPPENQVVEMGLTNVTFDPETLEISVGTPLEFLFRPTKAMTPDNMAIHHLTMADLEKAPICTPDQIVKLLTAGDPFGVVTHNWAFDSMFIPPLEGILPICTLKSAYRLWPDAPNHKNQTLRYWLGMDLDAAHAMPPHRAGPDSFVTAHIFARMLKETRVNSLVQWTKMPRYIPVCPLKKHKGQRWGDIPHDYLAWILREPEMDADMKATAQAEIDRRRDTTT